MNFEFMQGLGGLDKVFSICTNAEELAVPMPSMSLIASRKSAEALARFVFLVAHAEEMCELSFVELLSDPHVKRYLNDSEVLSAFHFIRKRGNTAVHTLKEETVEAAVEVLRCLHFVVGEVAKKMGLVAGYPAFDADIAVKEGVQPQEVDVDVLAREIYDDYVLSKNRVNRLGAELNELCLPFRFIPGTMDLNEILEFAHKPKHQSTVTYIQEHFLFLAIKAIKSQRGELEDGDIDYTPILTIYGENGYTATNLCDFANGILHDLPNADGFKIVSLYYGPSVDPWWNKEVREGFEKQLDRVGKDEQFTYSSYEFQYNHGAGWCSKCENGRWIDLESQYTTDILDMDFGEDWCCNNLDLDVEFDFEKYPDILQALQQTVRKHIPADQLEYCEGAWEDGDVQILISSITWTPRTLRVVQDFLDEINGILEPIKDECDAFGGECGWFQVKGPFATANWDWTEQGFQVRGVCL